MAGLAHERAGLGEHELRGLQLVDRVDLPGQVVEPDARSLRAVARPDPEQAEVVVVAAARQPEERRVGARLERRDLHAEHALVEGQRPLEVGHVEHGVVEPDGGDCHEGPLGGRWRDIVTTCPSSTAFLTRQ